MLKTIPVLPRLVNTAPTITRLGKGLSFEFLVEVDDRPFHVVIEDGRVADVAEGPFRMRGWRFAVRASAEAWEVFSQPYPPPGYHDIFAMARYGHARVEGDMHFLLSNLRFVKAVLAALRTPSVEKEGVDHG